MEQNNDNKSAGNTPDYNTMTVSGVLGISEARNKEMNEKIQEILDKLFEEKGDITSVDLLGAVKEVTSDPVEAAFFGFIVTKSLSKQDSLMGMLGSIFGGMGMKEDAPDEESGARAASRAEEMNENAG